MTEKLLIKSIPLSEFDKKINRIYEYVTNVFIKQQRIVRFDDLWGDGTIWHPLSKSGAKIFYNEILQAWQTYTKDNCTKCNGSGYVQSYEDKFNCSCNLEIDEYLEKV